MSTNKWASGWVTPLGSVLPLPSIPQEEPKIICRLVKRPSPRQGELGCHFREPRGVGEGVGFEVKPEEPEAKKKFYQETCMASSSSSEAAQSHDPALSGETQGAEASAQPGGRRQEGP